MSNVEAGIESRKDAMLDKAEARMKQIDAEVDRLKARAGEAEADRRIALEKQLSELKEQRRAFKARIEDLKAAGDDALNDLSDGFERAWTTLSDALGRARARFQ